MASLGSDVLIRRLRKALRIAGDTHTIEDVQDAIARGEMQAWVNGNSFVVTSLHQTPRKRILNVFLAVGELDKVLEIEPQLVAFARRNGCDMIETIARRGWMKHAKARGWHSRQEVFRRDL